MWNHAKKSFLDPENANFRPGSSERAKPSRKEKGNNFFLTKDFVGSKKYGLVGTSSSLACKLLLSKKIVGKFEKIDESNKPLASYGDDGYITEVQYNKDGFPIMHEIRSMRDDYIGHITFNYNNENSIIREAWFQDKNKIREFHIPDNSISSSIK